MFSLRYNSKRPEFIGIWAIPEHLTELYPPTNTPILPSGYCSAQLRGGHPGHSRLARKDLEAAAATAERRLPSASPASPRSPRPYSKTCSEVQILMAAAGAEPRPRPRRAPRPRPGPPRPVPQPRRACALQAGPAGLQSPRGAAAVTHGRVSPECRAEGAGRRSPPRPLRLRAGRGPAVRGTGAASRALNAL